MTNNDVLRQLRYALNLSDPQMIQCFLNGKVIMEQKDLINLLKKEEESGFSECPNRVLSAFLDGLIIENRGYRPPKPGASRPNPNRLNNNEILKKIRIALELKEDDMLEIFRLGEFKMNKAELSALFRSKGHRNFKPAGDQALRYFIRGLTRRNRQN